VNAHAPDPLHIQQVELYWFCSQKRRRPPRQLTGDAEAVLQLTCLPGVGALHGDLGFSAARTFGI